MPLHTNQNLHTFIASILALMLLLILIHTVQQISFLYFAAVFSVASLVLISSYKQIPGFQFISSLKRQDRLAVWIALIVLSIIGYLHNANTWIVDGNFHRPTNIALWKSELILGISLFITIAHWLTSILITKHTVIEGKQFAVEFALYVNFSGIALLLWSGESALSFSTFIAAFTLVALVELTLYASR